MQTPQSKLRDAYIRFFIIVGITIANLFFALISGNLSETRQAPEKPFSKVIDAPIVAITYPSYRQPKTAILKHAADERQTLTFVPRFERDKANVWIYFLKDTKQIEYLEEEDVKVFRESGVSEILMDYDYASINYTNDENEQKLLIYVLLQEDSELTVLDRNCRIAAMIARDLFGLPRLRTITDRFEHCSNIHG